MTFVEKTGKSVEEAVAAALQELNIAAEQAEVEVLQEAKKGFLGIGRKDAKVRVTVKEAEAVVEEVVYTEETVTVAMPEVPQAEEPAEEEAIAEQTAEVAVREPKKYAVNDEAIAKAK